MYQPDLTLLLHRALAARVLGLQEALAVPNWQNQPESLRHVRVASRRARAALALVEPASYPGHGRVSRRLRKLTRALGRTRELDAQSRLLASLSPGLEAPLAAAALDHALELLARRASRERRHLARDLHRLPVKGLRRLLAQPLPNAPAAPALWARLGPWLEAALAPESEAQAETAPAGLHQRRIRIKRLRYALEVLGEAAPAALEPPLATLKAIQDALGRHHDLATLAASLNRLQSRLRARQRTALASGCQDLLDRIGPELTLAYQSFRTQAGAMAAAGFCADLKQRLGWLPGPEGQVTP